MTKSLDTVTVSIQTEGIIPVDTYQVKILNFEDEIIAQQAVSINTRQIQIPVKNIHAWTAESPTFIPLYCGTRRRYFCNKLWIPYNSFDENDLYINDQRYS